MVILLPWKDDLQPAATSSNTTSDPRTRIDSAMTYDGGIPILPSLDNASVTTTDGGFEPIEEELPIVVHRNSGAIKGSGDLESKVDYVPLRIGMPESAETEGNKSPDVRFKPTARKTTTFKKKRGFPACFKVANSDKNDTFVPTRKRGGPAGSKPAKRRMEPKMAGKPELVDDIHNSDLTGNAETKRKRGGPAGSKPAKRRMEQKIVRKPALVHDIQHSDLTSDIETKRKRGGAAGSKPAKRRMEWKMARKPALVDNIHDATLTRDREAKVKLPGEYPSFTKRMLKSHVVHGFWLGLPGSFCTEHLPKENCTITLEDEHGEIYHTNYLHDRMALSGGWGEFARKHSIRVGDDVVFQLDGTEKFKVHILRNGPPGLDTSKKNNLWYEAEGSERGVHSKDHLEVTTGDNSSTSSMTATTFVREEAVGIDEHDVRFPDPGLGDVENFQVVHHGSIIDLPDGLHRRYYELCCAQKAVLHWNLLKTNQVLAEGVIMETSKIGECVMAPLHAAAAATSCEVLLVWKKKLGSLELFGMDVAFLRRRVDELLAIHAARASTVRVYSRRGWRRRESLKSEDGDSQGCSGGNGCPSMATEF